MILSRKPIFNICLGFQTLLSQTVKTIYNIQTHIKQNDKKEKKFKKQLLAGSPGGGQMRQESDELVPTRSDSDTPKERKFNRAPSPFVRCMSGELWRPSHFVLLF